MNERIRHRVPKSEFQSVLEGLGFRDVMIYINSGNAVFTSEHAPRAVDVQAALELHFGFAVPTLIVSSEGMRVIAEAIPPDWTNDTPRADKAGQKSDVLYLFDDINTPDIIEKLGYKPEVESMLYVNGAVLANIARVNQSKYSLLRIVGTPLYRQMTIRNITTAKRLAELAQ